MPRHPHHCPHLAPPPVQALYKPAAFFKGMLLPLGEDVGTTLREALIVSSVLSKARDAPLPDTFSPPPTLSRPLSLAHSLPPVHTSPTPHSQPSRSPPAPARCRSRCCTRPWPSSSSPRCHSLARGRSSSGRSSSRSARRQPAPATARPHRSTSPQQLARTAPRPYDYTVLQQHAPQPQRLPSQTAQPRPAA